MQEIFVSTFLLAYFLKKSCIYHQQQNKWYPQRCLLAHIFFSWIKIIILKLHSISAVANLLAHNNITIIMCKKIATA